MVKNILISSLISIFILIVGVLFIFFSHKTYDEKMPKNFFILKGYKTIFPFEIEVEEGTTYIEAIEKLGATSSVTHIYHKVSREWKKVEKNDFISKDETIKAE